MAKIIRLTENDLTNIVERVINESKKQPTKAEILDMSEDELENLGKIKGEYLGKKGEFFNFKKKGTMGVICGFRTDDTTTDGLKKSYRSLKVKDNEVKFNQKKTSVNESDKEKDNESNDKKFEKMVDVLEILKERWAGKDMEEYFYEKSREFIAKLKADLKK